MDSLWYAISTSFFGAVFLASFFLGAHTLFLKRFFRYRAVFSERSTGLLITLVFLLVLVAAPLPDFSWQWLSFIGGLLFLLVVAFVDDRYSLPWYIQLSAQGAALLFVYFGGVQIVSLTHFTGGIWQVTNGMWSPGMFLFLLWGIIVFNTLNWFDGIDGLAGSTVMWVGMAFFLLALSPSVYQPSIAIFSALLIGVTIAFLGYNLSSARLMAGTGGVWFWGLSIVFISTVAGTKIATILLVLAVPLIDTFYVLLKRFLKKMPLTRGDKNHLHHVLVDAGWSKGSILLFSNMLTGILLVLAMSTQALGKFLALLGTFIFLGILLGMIHFSPRFTSLYRKKILLATGIFGLIICGGVLSFREGKSVMIGSNWYRVEIADTEAERAAGLSGREKICNRCGMLFIFPKSAEAEFWMKDMKFSLDIIWIQNGRVVAKNENLPFPSLETFGPGVPVTEVLEVPAGAAKNITLGQRVFVW